MRAALFAPLQQAMGSIARPRLDAVVFAGWALLLLVGQCILPFRCRPLELAALGWLVAGMLLVRPGACLPLLVLTCPAFMCDSGHATAWTQELVAAALLARILVAARGDRRTRLLVGLAAACVLFLSWPREFGALWQGAQGKPPAKVVEQFLGAEASWYTFPMRQCAQRALAAALAAGAVCVPAFFSSRRVWSALFAAGVLAMLATCGHMLLPWHEPHHFLGTTNHARFAGLLFHGAGYNLSYFAFLVALALPGFAIAAASRTRRVWVGLSGLLGLAVFILQIAFYAAAAATALLSGAAAVMNRVARRRPSVRVPRAAWLLFAVTLALSIAYVSRLRVVAGAPEVRLALGLAARRFLPNALITLAAATALAGISLLTLRLFLKRLAAAPDGWRRLLRRGVLVCLAVWVGGSALELSGLHAAHGAGFGSRWAKRAEPWLARVEPARADMWTLGAGQILDRYAIRGAGAGAWARFHRTAPRRTPLYYAHMHNTWLDVAFEYGSVAFLLGFVCLLLAVLRLAAARDFNRLWLLYLAPCLVMAVGQHLLYAFTNVCLLLPVAIAAARALRPATSWASAPADSRG
jgi:hypothetical protein